MNISGERILPASRQLVWDLFNDPQRLARLIPGCERLEQIAPDEFTGTINIGIAGVKGLYMGTLKLDEISQPEHYKMNVDGKGNQGFMRGFGTLDLATKNDNSNHTGVSYTGDVQVGGTLVQVGQRVIDSAAKMLIGQFFAAAEAELKANAVGAVARQGFLINFWRYLLNLVRSLLARRH
jgi:carbon monoxide dehydrogenase subunit G